MSESAANTTAAPPVAEVAPTGIRRTLRRTVRWLGVVALLVSVSVGVVLAQAWVALGKQPTAARLQRMQSSPEWSAELTHFVNPEPLWNDPWGMLTEAVSADAHGSPAQSPPVVDVDPALFETPPSSGLRITWLGHSTLIVEIEGHRFLTDPLWGERASPVDWAGPRRWYAPPLALEDVPALDAVIISHDHYDHLDHRTMLQLAERDTTFITPLGVGAHLAYWGIPEDRIVELDWWETHRFGDLELVCTPARHASGRALWDKDRTLWAGYAFVGQERRAFFSGDTGLFPAMTEIGQRYGPFDVTMIEVGAYGQAWPDWHLGPEQAVRAHQMLRGRVMLPVHWGLFNLAYHGWTEPIERVLVAARQRQVQVVAPRPGESFEPQSSQPVTRWWPELPWRTAQAYPIVATLVPPETP